MYTLRTSCPCSTLHTLRILSTLHIHPHLAYLWLCILHTLRTLCIHILRTSHNSFYFCVVFLMLPIRCPLDSHSHLPSTRAGHCLTRHATALTAARAVFGTCLRHALLTLREEPQPPSSPASPPQPMLLLTLQRTNTHRCHVTTKRNLLEFETSSTPTRASAELRRIIMKCMKTHTSTRRAPYNINTQSF